MNVEHYYETKSKNEKDYIDWLIQEIQKIEIEMGIKLYTPPSERSKSNLKHTHLSLTSPKRVRELLYLLGLLN